MNCEDTTTLKKGRQKRDILGMYVCACVGTNATEQPRQTHNSTK